MNKFTVMLLSTNGDLAGAPIHVLSIIKLLQSRVNFISIFGEDGPIPEMIRKLGLPVEIVPDMRSAVNPLHDFSAICSILSYVDRYKPDLIHAHSSKAGMLGRIVAAKCSLPCVYTVHGWGWRGLSFFKAVAVFVIEKILSYAPNSSLIYVSNSVKDEARKKLFLPENLGVVIHNGVEDHLDSLPCHIHPGDFLRILMPARVSEAKDHATLIKAFERFKFPSHLYLCGGGSNSKQFMAQARSWAPTRFSNISFLGARSDVPALLNKCDIFALISNFEALPISVIEAMSAGKAIIASDVGGIRELIDDGVSGFIVPVNNVHAIVNSMMYFSDASLRKKCGESARYKYHLNFTSELMGNKIFQHYLNSINFGNI